MGWGVAKAFQQPSLLGDDRRATSSLPAEGYLVEVREADVLSASVPPHPGDSEIQHPGLSAKVLLLIYP